MRWWWRRICMGKRRWRKPRTCHMSWHTCWSSCEILIIFFAPNWDFFFDFDKTLWEIYKKSICRFISRPHQLIVHETSFTVNLSQNQNYTLDDLLFILHFNYIQFTRPTTTSTTMARRLLQCSASQEAFLMANKKAELSRQRHTAAAVWGFFLREGTNQRRLILMRHV